jgi:arsenite methyltransferase
MSETITQAVKDKYGSVAISGLSSDHEGFKAVAQAFGYTPEELASIPAEANMGLSCGNPTAFANLREGEVVVDLGSGGGSMCCSPQGRSVLRARQSAST